MSEHVSSYGLDRLDGRKLDHVPSVSTSQKFEPLLQNVLQKKKALTATTEKLRCFISSLKSEFKTAQHFNILGQKMDSHLEFKKHKFFNGSNFRGLWSPMTMEGPGIYTFHNGVTYKGELMDGMLEGEGLLTFPNGATIRGYWIHGIVFNPQYTFADGLNFHSKDWNYCQMPDRRFQSEILHGLRPTGNVQLSNDHPARAIPWGLLDTGEGFYDPYSNLLIHPITGESIRWSDGSLCEELHLPEKNEFIPTLFELCSRDDNTSNMPLERYNSSYLLGLDSVYTMEPTYFFTFYSEFGERLVEARLEAVILTGVLLVSLLTNAILISGLVRAHHKTVTNCFLLNLGLADVLFAIGIPIVVAARLSPDWVLGDFVCRTLPYSQLVCGFTVLWSLTFISIERYRCLTLDPRLKISASSATGLILALWTFAFCLFLPIPFWFRYEASLHICTLMFPRAAVKISLVFTVLITLFTCILPMCILVFNYQRIFMKMMENREKWTTRCVVTSSLSRQEEQRLNKQLRVMRVALVNVGVVLVMWLPITVVLCLIYIDGDRLLTDTAFFLRSHHFIWALSLALLNTAVNPLLCGALRIHGCCPPQPSHSPSSLSRLLRMGSSFNSK